MITIQWTEPKPPSLTGCRYDHVTAVMPFGTFSIEWKGWKQRDLHTCYFNDDYISNGSDLEEAKSICLKFYTDKLAEHQSSWPCWSCNKPVTEEQRAEADGNCPHCRVELDNWPPTAQQTVQQLLDSDHVVIIWTPEEVGEADPDDLESLCIQRGHAYLEDFKEPEEDE